MFLQVFITLSLILNMTWFGNNTFIESEIASGNSSMTLLTASTNLPLSLPTNTINGLICLFPEIYFC